MNAFTEKININWWLWAVFTIPITVYRFSTPYEHEGYWQVSDANYLMNWLRDSPPTWQFWHAVDNALYRNFYLPFVIGFFLQFLVVVIWRIHIRKYKT